jgi:hypothetical protein
MANKEKISWVLADSIVLDPTMDVDQLKTLGPFWGSWRTWRSYQTDNVICHDQRKASELTARNFQNSCNFYIPNNVYSIVGRPENVRLYEGAFGSDVDRPEEIVALHLAASTSDIILLLGFDLTKIAQTEDRLATHRAQHFRNHIRQVILDNNQATWVVVDHPEELDPNLAVLDNIVLDTLENVLTLSSN